MTDHLDIDAIDARLATFAARAEAGTLYPSIDDLLDMGYDLRRAASELRRLRARTETYKAALRAIMEHEETNTGGCDWAYFAARDALASGGAAGEER
jgi:DNA mismatch repair ATPase MutS